jgi:hypothetical protein
MPTQGVEPWENHQFPEGGMLKFTYKGCFFTIKIGYETFLDWKSKRWKHALLPLLYIEFFIFEKHWNLDFWLNFKVLSLSRFGQILAVLGSFGQVWAEIAALIVAESLPKVWLKILKPHNS